MKTFIKTFKNWLLETKHSFDPTGWEPSAWENKRVSRNIDGKLGKISEPIGDSNKGATKYKIQYDDGTNEVLSISAIKKHYEFLR